ncbi:hypothetical protein LshimejAT787_0803560 [Lyophyllum shimeji]|uniref:Uncharacterized protein n=1 Tax=Lyophyllum shimeji TaxID=47721 RepID=A0A9P3PPX9_LYOSH|nr:hypothetical protein LshimejAT787_0803560 [Lyophyllum shimeji]
MRPRIPFRPIPNSAASPVRRHSNPPWTIYARIGRRAVDEPELFPREERCLPRVYLQMVQLALHGSDSSRPLGGIELPAVALGVEVRVLASVVDEPQVFGFLDAREGTPERRGWSEVERAEWRFVVRLDVVQNGEAFVDCDCLSGLWFVRSVRACFCRGGSQNVRVDEYGSCPAVIEGEEFWETCLFWIGHYEESRTPEFYVRDLFTNM